MRGWVRKRSRESGSTSLSHLGLTYALAIIMYGLGGWWLDGRLGSEPWFTILGVALGAVGGFVWVYREVMRDSAVSRNKKEEEDKS
jgi:F0F1-type ATP synthase assembly protein I